MSCLRLPMIHQRAGRLLQSNFCSRKGREKTKSTRSLKATITLDYYGKTRHPWQQLKFVITMQHFWRVVLQPVFQIYGQCRAFSGPIVTLKVFEDNVLVRGTLETRGEDRVLVIDGAEV